MTDSEQFGFGGMYIGTAECSVEMAYTMMDELLGGTFTLDFGVEISNATEWIPLGVWNISDCERSGDNVIKITGMDNLAKLRVNTDEKKKNYTGVVTIEKLMKHVEDIAGVKFAQTITQLEELAGHQLSTSIYAVTYGSTAWEEVKAIAQVIGCFAFANRKGEIEFRRLDNTSPVLKITAESRKSASLSEYTYTVSGVQYTDSYGYTVKKNIDGASEYGAVVGFSDCFMVWETTENPDTQYNYYLDFIANNLKNVKFTPGTVEYYGNPALDVGDYVTISGGVAKHSGDVPFLICCNSWKFRSPQTLTACGFSDSYDGSDNSSTSAETQQIRTANVTKSIVRVDMLSYTGDFNGMVSFTDFACSSETQAFVEFNGTFVGGNMIRISVLIDDVESDFHPIQTLHTDEYTTIHFSLPISAESGNHTVTINADGSGYAEQICAYIWGQNLKEISSEETSESDYIYKISNNKTEIIYYIGDSVYPEIPETIKDTPVTVLSATSFNYAEISGVYIPDGVTEID